MQEEKEYLEYEIKEESNLAIWELIKGVALTLFAIPGIVYFGSTLHGVALGLIIMPSLVYLFGIKYIYCWYQCRMRIKFLKQELALNGQKETGDSK
jgi:nucleoside recognition membrane protein YjiH